MFIDSAYDWGRKQGREGTMGTTVADFLLEARQICGAFLIGQEAMQDNRDETVIVFSLEAEARGEVLTSTIILLLFDRKGKQCGISSMFLVSFDWTGK